MLRRSWVGLLLGGVVGFVPAPRALFRPALAGPPRLLRAIVSAAGVAEDALAGPHPASLSEELLLRECQLERTRRSGPGGQHRNKVESAIVATHLPTGVRAEASERRSQEQNRDMAVTRLRLRLALDVRRPLSAEPSALWCARRTAAGKFSVSDQHIDFPALVAEALDCVVAREYDVRAAAEGLGVSTSQLVKLLSAAQPALRNVNEARVRAGMPPLRD